MCNISMFSSTFLFTFKLFIIVCQFQYIGGEMSRGDINLEMKIILSGNNGKYTYISLYCVVQSRSNVLKLLNCLIQCVYSVCVVSVCRSYR